MNVHDEITELLARRRELTPDEERELRAHLTKCPECARTARTFEQQDQLLAPLGAAALSESVREVVLHHRSRRRRPLLWPLAAAGAALLSIAGGIRIVSGGGLPWVQPDRIRGGGYSGPSSGIFTPATPGADVLSRAQAIRLALRQAAGITTGIVPAGVTADAFLGTYTDTLFKPRLVWIVRFHGPGISIPSDGPIASRVDTLLCPRPVAHEETAILDARSGARVEETVGLVAAGLPVTVTPAPQPTPCPTAPPTLIAPGALAVAPTGNVLEVGEGQMSSRDQIQNRTPSGRLLGPWPAGPSRRFQQVSAIGTDVYGDVYLVGGNETTGVQKFASDGRLLWQRTLPTSYMRIASIAVAPDGTSYVSEGGPTPGVRAIAPTGILRAFWPGRVQEFYQIAVSLQGHLFGARGHSVTVLSTANGRRIARWHVEPAPGHGVIEAMAAAPDGTVWLLEARSMPTGYPHFEMARFTADGHLLTRWRLPAVPGNAEIQGSEFTAVALGRDGHLYVADSGRARVLVFSTRGQLTDSW